MRTLSEDADNQVMNTHLGYGDAYATKFLQRKTRSTRCYSRLYQEGMETRAFSGEKFSHWIYKASKALAKPAKSLARTLTKHDLTKQRSKKT